jgi:uncharacterized protein (TIGR00645 family)
MVQSRIETWFERGLFAARWLVAPIYLGLVGSLLVLLVMLGKYVVLIVNELPTASLHDAVIAILSLIDLTLIGNLVLIVLYTGYESFVSKLDIEGHQDRPGWLGKVDFSGLKLKLFASIVAITGIELLKAFMDLSEIGQANQRKLVWLVTIHLVFLLTTIGAALSQRLATPQSKQP